MAESIQITQSEWRKLWNSLPEAQKQRIGAKARWEGVSLLAVYRDYPGLFEKSDANQGDTKDIPRTVLYPTD